MEHAVVRIDKKSHATLKKLAKKSGKSQSAVMADAIEALRRKQFFEELHQSFTELRADPKAWKAELKEREIWDTALADGLDE